MMGGRHGGFGGRFGAVGKGRSGYGMGSDGNPSPRHRCRRCKSPAGKFCFRTASTPRPVCMHGTAGRMPAVPAARQGMNGAPCGYVAGETLPPPCPGARGARHARTHAVRARYAELGRHSDDGYGWCEGVLRRVFGWEYNDRPAGHDADGNPAIYSLAVKNGRSRGDRADPDGRCAAALEHVCDRGRRRQERSPGSRSGRHRDDAAVRRDDAGRMSVVADPTGAMVPLEVKNTIGAHW